MRAGCAVLRQLATERPLVILVILVGVGPASITVPMDPPPRSLASSHELLCSAPEVRIGINVIPSRLSTLPVVRHLFGADTGLVQLTRCVDQTPGCSRRGS
jgi:hypothetical protein